MDPVTGIRAVVFPFGGPVEGLAESWCRGWCPIFTGPDICRPSTEVLWWSRDRGSRQVVAHHVPRPRESVRP